jgi:hypothetical protein
MIKRLFDLLDKIASQSRPRIVVALLFLVLGIAIWLRSLAPGIPISDPDTWGYLYPALSEIAGMGFQQTHGRGIAYPLFLLGVLEVTGSFFSIVNAQHCVGILSGLLWWAVWREWQKWLPGKISGVFWVQCIGLVFLASYLWNANTIFYEEAIRPESIFPFLALVQIYFCMLYVRVCYSGGSKWLLLVAGSCAMLVAPICVSAKPSWGFAAGVPFALVVAGVFWKKSSRTLITRISPLAIGLALVFLWAKFLPPALGWLPDERSKGFLPATLFTVHAPTISKALHARVEKRESTPQEIAFLEKWDRRIKESSNLEKTSYKILDHDPDYLFYHSDAIADLPRADSAEKRREYMYSAYFDALLEFPIDITIKILKQLHAVHSDLTKTLYRRDYGFARSFSGSIKSMDFYKLPEIDPDLTASYLSVRKQSEKIMKASDEKLRFGPSVNKFLTLGVGPAFLGFWMLAWPALIVFLFVKRKTEDNSLVRAIFVFGIFWASAIGTTFTVAVVHSFDIDRYLHLLSVQHSMILAAAMVITIAWFSAKVAQLFSNKVS